MVGKAFSTSDIEKGGASKKMPIMVTRISRGPARGSSKGPWPIVAAIGDHRSWSRCPSHSVGASSQLAVGH